MFHDSPMNGGDEDWLSELGHGWSNDTSNSSIARRAEGGASLYRVASQAVPSSAFLLVAELVARRSRSGEPIWSVWDRDLHYSLGRTDDPDGPLVALPDVVWAAPTDHGRVIVATSDAKLRMRRFDHSNDDAVPAPVVAMEHDLNGLMPNPGPAPVWAKASLD